MAFDEGLAERVRGMLAELEGDADLVEKRMFGGVGFMLQGNMACGVQGEDLIVRVGPERYAEALIEPHVGEFDFTGRPMRGWVVVAPDGYESNDDLNGWVRRGADFARSLPPK
jgi:hypothetical protein